MGAAFHAGALSALHLDLGWDPRSAEVIVGTSAGSLVGALLRLGVPPEDLAATSVGAPAADSPASIVQALSTRPELPGFGYRHVLRVPRVPGPTGLAGLVAHQLRRGSSGLGSLALLLPDGDESLLPHLAFLDDPTFENWPDRDLLVCAARRRDSRRAVFGPGGRPARLSEAVAASCAVPGYFESVDIDGDSYVDGGVISPTNADVLRSSQLDLVIVLSPMSGTGSRLSPSGSVRRFCRRVLDRELSMLERRGVSTLVVEPDEQVLAHVTGDFMCTEAVTEVVRASFLAAGRAAATDDRFDVIRATERSAA